MRPACCTRAHPCTSPRRSCTRGTRIPPGCSARRSQDRWRRRSDRGQSAHQKKPPPRDSRQVNPTRSDQSRTPGICRLAVAHLGFAELASRAAPRPECDPARLHHVIPVGLRAASLSGKVEGGRHRALSHLEQSGSKPARRPPRRLLHDRRDTSHDRPRAETARGGRASSPSAPVSCSSSGLRLLLDRDSA